MMNRWNVPGIPHKGWACVDVTDLGEDTCDRESCGMCGQESIRFVHIMQHSDYLEAVRVGCVCAEKMSGDYTGPKDRERTLKNKSTRKKKWLSRQWRTSASGNPYLNIKGKNVVVFKRGQQWSFGVNGNFSSKSYPSADEAKLALFEALQTSD